MPRAGRAGIVWALGVALALTRPGYAQQVHLTLSGAPSVFPAPTVADYDNGFVPDPTGVTYTVQITGGGNNPHTATVSIRSASASLGGGKALSDLQWQRSGTTTWTAMTGTDVTVEGPRTVRKNDNPPWSNSLFFRILLSWTGDPPGSYSATLVFTVTSS